MDTQKLLEAPKPKLKIVAKVSKINNLVEVSTEARKTSTSLRKTFEKGAYQRKTQLSVLNRYKKRLDSIQKEQDKKYERQIKKKPSKVKIPKFAGSFFTKGSSDDPFKAIGALAAFNSLDKLLEGDFLGALSPGMVAAAALLGPGLLGLVGGGFGGGRGKGPQGFFRKGDTRDVTKRMQGNTLYKHSNKSFQQVDDSIMKRYFQKYGKTAFIGRFGKDALKTTKQGSEVASTVGNGGRVAKAFGKFGSAMIPGVGAVVGAADAVLRAQSGDTTGAAIAGTGAGLDAAAAASAATGIGLPVAGLLSIASFALDVTNLVRDITGMSAQQEQNTQKKLDKQEKQQKQLAKPESNLTFSTTLVSYEKALIKFDDFAKGFKGSMGMNEQQVRETAARIEDLGGGSSPISAAGYEFTNESSFSQYLTGDPNAPGGAYDASHGTVSNYHDHLAFKDAATTKRAYDFLKSKGIEVTELGVTSGHSQGSAHYSGRAFDVPGAQWGGSGAIGQKEYEGSAKVRGFMNDFYKLEQQRSKDPGNNMGAVLKGPDDGYIALLHGTEAIIPIDNYHTRSGGDPLLNISPDILNSISSKSKNYQLAMGSMPPEVIEVPMPIMPPQIQYVSSGSGSLNIEDDADKKLLKMLFYSALG